MLVLFKNYCLKWIIIARLGLLSGLFCAGVIRASWITHELDFQPTYLAYGNETFVSVATTGLAEQSRLARSTDLSHWEFVELPRSVYPANLVFTGGEFFYLAHFAGTGYLYRSTDGETWHETELPFNSLPSTIAYFEGRLVIGCSNNLPYSILVSEDGDSWTQHEIEDVTMDAYRLAPGPDKLVAIGGGSWGFRHATSSDGENWSGSSTVGDFSLSGLAYNRGWWVALLADTYNIFSPNQSVYFMTSTDGIDWTQTEISGFTQAGGITASADGFSAVVSPNTGDPESYLITSGDGIGWAGEFVASDIITGIVSVGDSLFLYSYDTIYRRGPLPGEVTPTDPYLAFFSEDLYVFPDSLPGTSQWYFSFTLKDLFHFAGNSWFYSMPFNAYLWIDTSGGSLSAGFWSYFLFPDGHDSWGYLARDGNFYDLRDSNGDGVTDLPDSMAGSRTLSGYIFLQEPFAGDPDGSQWYYFEEFPSGNWIVNLGITSPLNTDWHQLR